MPKKGIKHYAGVDVASGTGGEMIIAQWLYTMQMVNKWLVFMANDVPVYTFAEIVNSLGRFFNYAFICVGKK